MDASFLSGAGIRNPYTREQLRSAHLAPPRPEESQAPSPQATGLLREAQELPHQIPSEEEHRAIIAAKRLHLKERASTLALSYVSSLGLDPGSPEGRAWLQKTIKFYGANEHFLKRLEQIVETARTNGLVQ